jgi:hypothetical protein
MKTPRGSHPTAQTAFACDAKDRSQHERHSWAAQRRCRLPPCAHGWFCEVDILLRARQEESLIKRARPKKHEPLDPKQSLWRFTAESLHKDAKILGRQHHAAESAAPAAPEIAAWGTFFRRGHAEGLVRPASPEPRLTGNWAQYCADAFSCVKAAIVRATYTALLAADAEAISEAPDQAPVIAKPTLEWLEARKDLYGASDLISYYRTIEQRRRPALPEEQPLRRQQPESVQEWRLLAPEMQLERSSRLDPALGRTRLWRQMTEMEHIGLWRLLQDPERRELWALLGERGQGVFWDEMRHLDRMTRDPSLRRNKTDLWDMLTDQERLSLWVQMDEPAKRETWFAMELPDREDLWALLVYLDWTSGEPLNQVGLWNLLAFNPGDLADWRRSELLDQLSVTQQHELWEVLPEPQTHVLWRLLPEPRRHGLWGLLSAEQRQIFLVQTPMQEQRGVPDQEGQEADSGQGLREGHVPPQATGRAVQWRASQAAQANQLAQNDQWTPVVQNSAPMAPQQERVQIWTASTLEGAIEARRAGLRNRWVRSSGPERRRQWTEMTQAERWTMWNLLGREEQRDLWARLPVPKRRRLSLHISPHELGQFDMHSPMVMSEDRSDDEEQSDD